MVGGNRTNTGLGRVLTVAGCAMWAGLAASVLAPTARAMQPDASAARPASAATAGEPVFYKGSIAVPSMALEFSLKLTRGLDGTPSGTIDIPMQSFLNQPLLDLVWTEDRLSFAVALPGQDRDVWPSFEFTLTPDAGEHAGEESAPHSGKLRQAGMELDATVQRIAEAPPPPKRPQTPVAPFPYQSREVEFRNEAGGLQIAGTLTVPKGQGPFPCAVMITGSGPQDRDETLFEHKPFLVIADHLSRNGIAVLRCDDRGVGGSGRGNRMDPDSLDLATDTTAALDFVATQPGIDAARLGLIGHSEGGLIAPLLAADDPRISFIVLLAGPGVPGDEILVRQGEAMALAMGESAEDLEAMRPLRERLFGSLMEGDTEGARGALVELMGLAGGDGMTPDMIEATADAQMAALGSRWMLTFMEHDPREALRRVTCPVLALNGDKDLQVLEDQNLPEVERALREGGNKDVTAMVLPGLNHLFQPAATGAMTEYASIETTVDPSVLEIVTRWVRQRTGLEGPDGGR